MTLPNRTMHIERNGTVIAERIERSGTMSLTAMALSAAICTTGFSNAVPLALNGTHIVSIGTVLSAAPVAAQTAVLSDMLTEIRSNFELTTTELARALGVSRPTLYAWGAEKYVPRGEHLRRVQALREASVEWRRRIGDRQTSVVQRFNDKEAIVALLTNTALDRQVLAGELAALAEGRNALPRVESIADRLRALGFPDGSMDERRRNLESQGW